MRRSIISMPILGGVALILAVSGWSAPVDDELRLAASRAINNLKSSDSTLTNFFARAAGYVVFPGVNRGRLDRIGMEARGVVYERGQPVGEAVLVEPDRTAQDQTTPFHELIFFEDHEVLARFKQGRLVKSADLGAVSLVEGAGSRTSYQQGAAVFVVPKCGSLVDIAIGEQRFTYQPWEASSEPVRRGE